MKKYIFLILTLCTFLFASCANFFEDSVSDGESSSSSTEELNESIKYITVTGNINLEGAYPQEILNQVQDAIFSNRTAFPTAPALTDCASFNITAVYGTEQTVAATGEIISGSSNSSYRINIPAGDTAVNYKIKIEAYAHNNKILTGLSEDFTITRNSPTSVKNVTLSTVTSEGTGTFSLSVNIATDAGINSAKIIYQNNNGDTVSIQTGKASNACTFAKGTIGTSAITNGVECGSYLMTFEFYSGSIESTHVTGNLVYSFKQTVNIFNGLETNTWVKNGAETYLSVSGGTTTCTITKAMVDSYALANLYVKQGASASGSGSFLSPVPSIDKAVEKMHNKDVDYIIHIDGEVSGKHEIPDTLRSDGTGTYNAKSVTICGKTGLDANGLPQDCLNGNYASNSNTVLKITTAVPVHIKDLQITGGNLSGLRCELGSNVVTYSGVLIGKNMDTDPTLANCGNKATGIVNFGNLLIQNSKICGNYRKGIESGGNGNPQPYLEVRDAIITRNGKSGLLVASGEDETLLSAKIIRTQITHNGNNGDSGGGFYGDEGSSTEFYDCVISDNIAKQGGGLYSFAKSVKLENCTVKDNSAVEGGAGIWVQETDELTLSGTSQFIDNIADSGAGAIHIACYLGPLYIGDDVYIPYGGEDGKNDIYITEAYLTITSSLTKHSKWNPIQLRLVHYGEEETVLTANDTSVHLEVEKVKFDVKPQALDGGGTKAWGIDNDGKLKSLIGKKSRPTALYDIVFNDGSATAYSNGLDLSDTEKGAAIAVIYYIGTDCSNDGTTKRMLGVGLVQSTSGLAFMNGVLQNQYIPPIKCFANGGHRKPSEGWEFSAGSDKNGSDNLEQIRQYLGTDDDTTDSGKYPLFYYAKDYASKDGSHVNDTEYADGWYIPSFCELAHIFWEPYDGSTCTVFRVNQAINKCAGTQIIVNSDGSHFYASSSRNDTTFHPCMQINNFDFCWYEKFDIESAYAIVIHEF